MKEVLKLYARLDSLNSNFHISPRVCSEGWNLPDGPAGDAPPIPRSSVSVHADDPHRRLHHCRPRDSRGTAAAPKQTTPHSTIGRSRIRSARSSASIWSACICAPANSHTTASSVREIGVAILFFLPREKSRGIGKNGALTDFCEIAPWVIVDVYACMWMRACLCACVERIGSDRAVCARRFVSDLKRTIDPTC